MQPITVVIPSLNSEDEIEGALASLAPQLLKEDEVIIVDGGSKDQTLEIAYKFGCKIFIYPDASLGQARDFGAEMAENDIILQTDSDVIFCKDFMDRLRSHFEDAEVVAVSGGWRDAKNRILGNVTCAILEGIMRYADCIQAYRKEVYFQTKGHPDTSFGEQIGNWIQLSRMGKTVYDPDMWVLHLSDRQVSIPSYLIGGSFLAGGAAYEVGVGGELGYLLMGHGAGWMAGQAGVEILRKVPGIEEYWSDPDHLHHWKIGMLILAAGMAFSPVLPEEVEYALYGFGSGLVVHDIVTEPDATQP